EETVGDLNIATNRCVNFGMLDERLFQLGRALQPGAFQQAPGTAFRLDRAEGRARRLQDAEAAEYAKGLPTRFDLGAACGFGAPRRFSRSLARLALSAG